MISPQPRFNVLPYLLFTFLLLPLSTVFSQTIEGDPDESLLEEIYVTGSLIKKNSFDGVSAVQVLDRADIQSANHTTIADLLADSPLTGGVIATFSPGGDGLDVVASQPVNLRNLGFGSTLVLMNGRRMPFAGAIDAEGIQFVDINSIPTGMIERIEILKTGASATYGSDAAAGVMNIITRTQFDGFDLNLNYGDATENGYDEFTIDGTWGISSDRGRAVFSVSHYERDLLRIADSELGDDVGSLLVPGFRPGSWFPANAAGMSVGPPILLDPDCASTPGHTIVSGTCRFDLVGQGFFAVTSESDRTNGMATFGWDITDNLEIYSEFSYSQIKDKRQFLPPSAGGGDYNPIPLTHPGIPPNIVAGAGMFGGTHLISLGSLRYAGGEQSPDKTVVPVELQTIRVSGGIRGSYNFINGNEWDFDANVVWGNSEGSTLNSPSFIRDRLNTSIDACTSATPIPDPIRAGQNFECFNPFLSVANSMPPNSEEFLDSLSVLRFQQYETELRTYEVYTTGSIMELGGGDLALAVGFQRREEDWVDTPDPLVTRGLLAGVQPRQGVTQDRYVNAYFGEVSLPFIDNLDFRVSVRHEDYEFGEDSTDPRVSAAWVPFEGGDALSSLELRGSWGTSFRAPQLNVTAGEVASSEQLTLPDGTLGGRLVIAAGDPTVAPEETESWTIGATMSFDNIGFGDSLEVGLDWWDYDVSNIIARESAQELVNTLCTPPGPGQGDGTNCDNSRGNFQLDGAQNITSFRTLFANTASLETSGLDLWAIWEGSSDWFDWTTRGDLTWVNNYDVQVNPTAAPVDALDSTNSQVRARTSVDLRWNIANTLRRGPHEGSVIIRYIDSFNDDVTGAVCTPRPGQTRTCGEIDSHLTVDMQYSYTFNDGFMGVGESSSLYIGANNVLNNHIPVSNGPFAHATEVFDARGRQVYGGMRVSF